MSQETRGSALGSPEAVVEFDDITRRYKDVTALDGLTYRIRRGETVALLGPNGAGKTTAAEIILGLQRPHRGEVRVYGGAQADAIASFILVITGGRLVASGTPDQIRAAAAGRTTVSFVADGVPLEILERLPGVETAEADRGRVTVYTTDADAPVRAVLDRVPQLEGLQITRAGMEEAFLSLTTSEGGS